jgi:hypothetical protein
MLIAMETSFGINLLTLVIIMILQVLVGMMFQNYTKKNLEVPMMLQVQEEEQKEL